MLKMWNWYMPVFFGLDPINYGVSIAIVGFIIVMKTFFVNHTKDIFKNTNEDKKERNILIVLNMLLIWFLLLIGYLCQLWI